MLSFPIQYPEHRVGPDSPAGFEIIWLENFFYQEKNMREDAASSYRQTKPCLSSTTHQPAHHKKIKHFFLLTCCVLELANSFPNQTCWDTRPDQAGIGISGSAAFPIQELEMLSKEIL